MELACERPNMLYFDEVTTFSSFYTGTNFFFERYTGTNFIFKKTHNYLVELHRNGLRPNLFMSVYISF